MSEDKTLVCIGCGKEFVFTEGEQKFFADKALSEPKRCVPCREAKKRERERQENSNY